jgi:hypothetical protein
MGPSSGDTTATSQATPRPLLPTVTYTSPERVRRPGKRCGGSNVSLEETQQRQNKTSIYICIFVFCFPVFFIQAKHVYIICYMDANLEYEVYTVNRQCKHLREQESPKKI